tara:strand:- start:8228 stop:8437 length:210 start_codon:yes stop_codon:yes gene_type:complete
MTEVHSTSFNKRLRETLERERGKAIMEVGEVANNLRLLGISDPHVRADVRQAIEDLEQLVIPLIRTIGK